MPVIGICLANAALSDLDTRAMCFVRFERISAWNCDICLSAFRYAVRRREAAWHAAGLL